MELNERQQSVMDSAMDDWYIMYRLRTQASLAIDIESANDLFDGTVMLKMDGPPYVLKCLPNPTIVVLTDVVL